MQRPTSALEMASAVFLLFFFYLHMLRPVNILAVFGDDVQHAGVCCFKFYCVAFFEGCCVIVYDFGVVFADNVDVGNLICIDSGFIPLDCSVSRCKGELEVASAFV